MRIGIVTTWFERGAAYVSRQYQKALSSRHEVFIYARGGEADARGNPEWDSDNVTWARACRLKNLPTSIDLAEFDRWLRHNRIEIVFFNEQFCWDPVVHCAENGILTGAYIDYYTEQTIPFFALHDFLVCNTRRHQAAFDWHANTHFVQWGTDLSLFSPAEGDTGIPGVVTFFHSAGMNPHRKGTDVFVRALDLLCDRPLRGVVHSQVPLRSAFPDLTPTIDRLQEMGKLICVEQTVAAPGLYHMGDVYVYPTRLDGLGLTVVEALACGLPAIVPHQEPMSEFIRPDVNGRLTPVDRLYSRWDGYYWPQCRIQPEALAIDLDWYLNHSHDLPDLQHKARQSAVEQHRWEDRYDQICGIFECPCPAKTDSRAEVMESVKSFELGRSRSARPKGSAFLSAYLHDRLPDLYSAVRSVKRSIGV